MNLKRITLDDTVEETVNKINENSTDIEENMSRLEANFIPYKDNITLKISKIEKELNDYKATMQQVNINQEPKQKVSGYGMVSLPKNAANGQVSASVKGATLKNELNYNRDTWEEWTLTGLNIVENGSLVIKRTTVQSTAILPTKFKPNTKYGFLTLVLSTFGTGVGRISCWTDAFADNNSSDAPLDSLFSEVGNRKLDLTSKQTIDNNRLYIRTNANDVEVKIKDLRVFELPTGSEIENDFETMTADQLALKYPYISGDDTKSTVGAVRIKSVGKNLFDKNRALKGYFLNFTNGVQEPYSSPSFCSDFIRVDSNEQYYVTGFLGKGYTFIAFYDSNKNFTRRTLASSRYNILISDIQDHEKYIRITVYNNVNSPATWQDIDDVLNNLQVERGSVATPYEPYRESNVYITAKNEAGSILELRSLPNGTKDEFRVSEGKLIQRIGHKENVASGTAINYADMADGGQFVAYYADGMQQIGVKGDTLTADAVQLNYQLATPIEIPIQVSGNLISYPSGTIYVEPFVADAGVYTDKIEVLHDGLPIKAIEKVSKVDFVTGIEVPLDVGEVEIDESGLSFTHPELNAGDIVFFEYEYDVESTEGETEVEFYDSRYVVKDDVTGKFYKWNVKVSNGTPTIEVVEV